MEKKGLIFDMDGTLWDSASAVAMCWSRVVKESGLIDRAVTTEDVMGVMGKTMDVIADILFGELSKKDRMALLEVCCNKENEYLKDNGAILYPELVSTLEELKKDYHLYIVSNCQKGYIEAFLDHYKLWYLFEDTECYGNNEQKKGVNIRLLADRNNLTKAYYVGDIQGDYEASREAGVGFIHASYGFGEVTADVPRIKSFSELKNAAKTLF